jgi:hypothetical protein
LKSDVKPHTSFSAAQTGRRLLGDEDQPTDRETGAGLGGPGPAMAHSAKRLAEEAGDQKKL